MKPRSTKELKSAIERNEVLYLSAQDYDLKRQIWQTLVYLREMLKRPENRRRNRDSNNPFNMLWENPGSKESGFFLVVCLNQNSQNYRINRICSQWLGLDPSPVFRRGVIVEDNWGEVCCQEELTTS